MLPNEEFALACRARYEQMGLVVDERNGEFAHCPYPRGMGDSGYYLLHEDHQHQGLLQSRDVGRMCFFSGYAKKWLMNCDPFPENYFELWDIYEEFMEARTKEWNKTMKLKCQRAVELTRMSDGEVFVFDSLADASRALDVSTGQLSKVCRKKIYSTSGFLARYWTPDVVDWGKGLFHLADEVIQTQKEERREAGFRGGSVSKLKLQKHVELTRMSDGEVFVFDSARNAARSLNLSTGQLIDTCNGKHLSVRGFLARYWTPDVVDWGKGLFHLVEEVEKQQRKKKTELTRLSDGAIFVFESSRDAANAFGLCFKKVSAVCLGQRKTHKGFTARYLT